MVFADVPKIIFKNKQNIRWNDVEKYLKKYIGQEYQVKETGDAKHNKEASGGWYRYDVGFTIIFELGW